MNSSVTAYSVVLTIILSHHTELIWHLIKRIQLYPMSTGCVAPMISSILLIKSSNRCNKSIKYKTSFDTSVFASVYIFHQLISKSFFYMHFPLTATPDIRPHFERRATGRARALAAGHYVVFLGNTLYYQINLKYCKK